MGSRKKTISYRYDAVRNRVGMTDPDGGRFTYAYDSVNRIKEVVNPQGERTTYAYDPGGRRTVKKLANGTRASFSYDAAGNLTRLANLKSDGTTISSFDYNYDKVGNRTVVLEADGSRVTWSYDATYQLTGEHRTGSNAYQDTYTYDAAGNRLLKIHDGTRTTSAYDAANQLTYSEDASGRTTYAFDADGNQELVVEPSGDRTTTSWDYENRTTLVQLPSGIRNTMAYEPDGLRVKLEESTGTKKFVWDEQNYLAETDENDDTQVVYTNEPRLCGNLVSQRRGSDSHWYQFDAIGSTRELTDASGTVTDTWLYDAWGTLLTEAANPPHSQWVGETGYYADVVAASYYIRQRHYTPSRSLWTSLDPLDTQAVGTNRYTYVANSPVSFVDPSGLANVAYTPERGIFRFASIESSYLPPGTKKAVPKDMGSTIDLQWNFDRDNFYFGPSDMYCPRCCRCRKIGFVQIIRTESVFWDIGATPIAIWPTHYLADWHIDRSIPYPHSTTEDPCDPSTPGFITMHDEPGPTPAGKLFGAPILPLPLNTLINFEQDAEACVVCLAGRECSLGDVHVYGCIKWYHYFERNGTNWRGATTGFDVTRTIANAGGTTTVPKEVTYTKNNYEGAAPSRRFKQLLEDSIPCVG